MTQVAWPFLVGRNRRLDYQVVLAPAFLAENGLIVRFGELVLELSA